MKATLVYHWPFSLYWENFFWQKSIKTDFPCHSKFDIYESYKCISKKRKKILFHIWCICHTKLFLTGTGNKRALSARHAIKPGFTLQWIIAKWKHWKNKRHDTFYIKKFAERRATFKWMFCYVPGNKYIRLFSKKTGRKISSE